MSGDVHVDFRKWPDRRHWQFSMRRLGLDEHGIWLWAPPGTELQRGKEPPIRSEHTFVKLITPDRWWTAIWNSGGRHLLYVDIATPPRWDGDRVTMVDLDLDILQERDSRRVRLLDEDEFLDHQRRYGYPPHLVDRARATAARVVVDVRAGAEPYEAAGPRWLDRAVALAQRGEGQLGDWA